MKKLLLQIILIAFIGMCCNSCEQSTQLKKSTSVSIPKHNTKRYSRKDIKPGKPNPHQQAVNLNENTNIFSKLDSIYHESSEETLYWEGYKPEFDGWKERQQMEFDFLKNPFTGKIPKNIKRQELVLAKSIPPTLHRGYRKGTSYQSRGPSNMGGRTRALAVDLSDPSGRTILAGGVSSGLFRTTNGGGLWERVSSLDAIHNVSCIAQDPSNPHIWYYGTGETIGNSASIGADLYPGDGIWKSIDNGLTWKQLESTSMDSESFFDFVFDIAINPKNGDVYAAVSNNIFRSINGGIDWEPVLGRGLDLQSNEYFGQVFTDIEINSTGKEFYTIFSSGSNLRDVFNPNNDPLEGIWASPLGEAGSWTKIAGNTINHVPNPNWRGMGRCILALNKPFDNTLYAFYVGDPLSICQNPLDVGLWVYDIKNKIWTDRSNNLPGCLNNFPAFDPQYGYNLSISIDPKNDQIVYIGGVSFYVSEDGFNTPEKIRQISTPHPDVHALVFNTQSDSNVLLLGTDGGVYQFNPDTNIFQDLNHEYVTLQYYYVTLEPTYGSSFIIGGTQDNGTTASYEGKLHQVVYGGDGVSVGLSEDHCGYIWEYFGYQNGVIMRQNSKNRSSSLRHIKPKTSGEGRFITLFYLDPDNTENLYYCDDHTIYRTGNASSVTTELTEGSWEILTSLSGNINCLSTSRGKYTSSSKLFVGNTLGEIFMLQDPQNKSSIKNITPKQAVRGAIVSSIAVHPQNDSILLATYSNYGIPSIFWTKDGGANWSDVEGNLSLPSIRSSVIALNGTNVEYFVGTSIGLYNTLNIDGSSPVWTQEGSNTIGYALVTSMAYRTSDKRLVVGTHGNGIFETSLVAPAASVLSFNGEKYLNFNQLTWSTQNEVNHKGFEIQKTNRSDSCNFETFAFIEANENQLSGEYLFRDKDNLKPTFYRLKSISLDGSYTLSSTIRLEASTREDIIIYPNPTRDQLTIVLPEGNNQENLILQLFDERGKLVFECSGKLDQMEEKISQNLPLMSTGLYVMKIKTQIEVYICKFLKE